MKNYLIHIVFGNGSGWVAICPDGTVEMSEGTTVPQATREFFLAVQKTAKEILELAKKPS